MWNNSDLQKLQILYEDVGGGNNSGFGGDTFSQVTVDSGADIGFPDGSKTKEDIERDGDSEADGIERDPNDTSISGECIDILGDIRGYLEENDQKDLDGLGGIKNMLEKTRDKLKSILDKSEIDSL